MGNLRKYEMRIRSREKNKREGGQFTFGRSNSEKKFSTKIGPKTLYFTSSLFGSFRCAKVPPGLLKEGGFASNLTEVIAGGHL